MIKRLNMHVKGFSRNGQFELLASILLLLIACGLLFSGLVLNPFRIADISKDGEIEISHKKKIDYVKLHDQTLDFTGYYKMDKNDKVVYNCYVTTGYEKKYFVFVPVNHSEGEDGKTLETLNNYSFEARIQREKELFKMVSKDYDLSASQFLEKYNVSNLVLDEVGAKRTEVLGIWIALFTILISYFGYNIIPLYQKRNIGGKQNG